MKYAIRFVAFGIVLLAFPVCAAADETLKPNIYVPYEDLAKLVEPAHKAMLMDRGQFRKLLAAAEAKAKAAEGLELGQVEQAQYTGTVSGKQLVLTGTLQVTSLSKTPVAVPLGFAQIGLTRVLLDGQPAPLGYDKKGRLTLIVAGKGRCRLEVKGTVKLKELSTGGMQFSLSLPPAVAGRMKLTAVGDLEMHATVPISKAVYDKQTDRTNAELTIGGQQSLTVVLLGNGRRQGQKPILLGTSAGNVTLTRSSQVMGCLYTVQVLRRGVRELQFRIPSQWTVTEVTCPSLVRWSVGILDENGDPQTQNTAFGDPNESGRGLKLLSVRLGSAKLGTVALHIKTAASRTGQLWHSPRINLVGAAFERGYLMVTTDEGLRVRSEKLADARRADISAAASVPGLAGAVADRLYFHWGSEWSVELELAQAELRRSIKERQKLIASPQQVTLIGDFEVTAIERKLFDVTFVIPGRRQQWHIKTVQVNEQQQGFEYRTEQAGAKQRLRIELARPVLPEKLANVKIVLQHVPTDWYWPSNAAKRSITVPLIESQAETVSGHLLLSATGDLDVLPGSVPTQLKAVAVGRMASLGIAREVQYAYSYKSALKADIELEVSRRRPRQSAQSVGLITVRPRGFTADWRFTYTISRASARRLHLLADKTLGEKIKFTSPTVALSSKNIVPANDKTLLLPDELKKRYDLWRLNLDQKTVGEVEISIHYERPLTADKFDVPLVRPICDGQTSEELAVQAGEDLSLTISAAGAKEIDAIDLPALPAAATRILAAFRLEPTTAQPPAQAAITLQTAIHKNYEIPAALALSAHLTTHLDVRGRQQTDATFRITNAGKQFLTFRLPKDSQLWSVRVDGRQAKPQRSAQGDYQLALGQSRRPVEVKIVYACRPAEAGLERLSLGKVELLGVDINKTRWNVIPPPGYLITRQQTKMHRLYLARPIPACMRLWNLLRQNLFGGSLLMPSLSRTRVLALSSSLAGGTTLSKEIKFYVDESRAIKERSEKYEPQLAKSTPEAEAPAQAARKPQARATTEALGVRLAHKGRFTLPVDLIRTAGSGPTAGFTALGPSELVIGLTSRGKMSSWWLVGFALILTIAIAAAAQKSKAKLTLFVAVLSAASLLAIWWPAATSFANGAFTAGLCLVPLYMLVALLRWLWRRLKLGTPLAYKSARVVALVLLALTLAGSAQAASRPVPQQSDKTALPPVIIPYDGDPTKAEDSQKILIPYARFVKLWNQAHPDDPIDKPPPGTDISVANVRYSATVDRKKFELVLTADIKTYGHDWAVLGLGMSKLAVTEATLDGKPAQLRSDPNGMVLLLPGEMSGRLQLRALAKPKYSGRSGRLHLSLPPLPAAVMDIVLPAAELELEVDGIEAIPARHAAGSPHWTFPLGMAQEMVLRWLPRAGAAAAADRTLSANSNHDVYAFDWAVLGVSTISYTFSAGQRDHFTLLLPEGVMLTDLNGPNLRDHRQAGKKTIDGRTFKLLEVHLYRAAEKQYNLTARWLGELMTLGRPAPLLLPRAGDVGRESGTLTLHTAEGMLMKVTQLTGGRRQNISADNDSTGSEVISEKTNVAAKYYWPYRPFSLSLKLARLTPSPKASFDQLVRIGTDRIQLLVEAKLKAERARLFGANFTLPKGYELLSVVGPAVENFYERSNNKGRFLNVKFHGSQNETKMALVLVRDAVPPADFTVPIITFADPNGQPAAEQDGRIAVQVDASLDVHSLGADNLKPIEPPKLRDWLATDQLKAVQFAYRYESPHPLLRLNIRRLPTRIGAETFIGLVVKNTAATYTYRLRYDITGSPLDHLAFSMPNQYAHLVEVTSPAMRSVTKSRTGTGSTTWNVALVNEVTGTVDVAVNFALPIDPSTTLLKVPRIQMTAPQGHRTIIAVQNISRHEINIADQTKLTELGPGDQRELIPRPIRQSLQYVLQSFDDDWSLGFDFKPAKTAARIKAVVDLLTLTTVIDRQGRCRYEAKVAIQNRSEQFLRIAVPRGLRLWSAAVAGQPVKPVTAADTPPDQVLIPLVKTSPGGLPYDVFLYFAGKAVQPLNGLTKLKPPAISLVEIPVTQTAWSLRLPDGYRYLRPGGNMSPVAGTAEMLSLGIQARLEQLKRLEKTCRDTAGSSSRTQKLAGGNWELFNDKLAAEITQAESFLDAGRGQVSSYEYQHLKSKLGRQRVAQNEMLKSNALYIRRQQEQSHSDMNVFLNAENTNAGVAEGIRNRALLERPEFVGDNERRQIARLKKELADSERDQKLLQAQNQAGMQMQQELRTETRGRDVQGPIAQSSEQGDVSGILEELSRENAAQIQRKQSQIRQQLSELTDNRAQRYFQRAKGRKTAEAAPASKPSKAKQRQAGAHKRPHDALGLGGIELPKREPAKAPLPREQASSQMAELSRAAGYGMQAYYTAGGTYSLPVSLPSGPVRLDFACPGGAAELSIWAVPTSVIHSLNGTLLVVAALFIIAVVVKFWPQPATKRPLSVKRIIIYVVLLVLPTIALGLLGLLLCLFIILLSEARRGLFIARPISQ